MITTLIAIGNSQGVRIPKVLLNESGLENEVELRVKKGEIRIMNIKPKKKSKITFNKEYFLSLEVLDDWNRPEEDEAWKHLQ